MKRQWCGRVSFLLVGLIGWNVYAAKLKLWPSTLCDARAHSASSIERLDSYLHVQTGTAYDWPGTTLFFKAGEMDLRAYGEVQAVVSNTTTRELTIHLVVKNRQHKDGTPSGSVTVAAGKAGLLKVALRQTPWILDQPLELVGMNGHPQTLAGAVLDLQRVAEFHLVLGKPKQAASFAILGLELLPQPLTYLKSAEFLPFVDQFGQFKHAQWPGKITQEAEMKTARSQEAKWLEQHRKDFDGQWSKWGGWLAGPRQAARGHFYCTKVDDKWWLVDPDGYLFFSHGINCVRAAASTGIQHRERYFEWLPEDNSPFAKFYGTEYWAPHGFYREHLPFKTFDFARANMLRKYGEAWEQEFRSLAHTRMRAWGINSIGNWSDHRVYEVQRTPYTVCINNRGPAIEGSQGWWGKFPDPYAPAFAEYLVHSMREQQKRGTPEDPWCLGYFVDNELSWGDNDVELARACLQSGAAQPAKQALQAWLKKQYPAITDLNRAWETKFDNWEAFLQQTEVPSNKFYEKDLRHFNEQIVEQYYRVVRDVLRAAAPHKLYLGSRIAWGQPMVYRAAAQFCDVVSVNIYNRSANRDLPEGSIDKPMINGEFHFGALDRGMFHTGLVPTRDQEERAACYTAFVESCLRHPRYVGTHWFQWQDQALTGRGDAENYQIGFVNVADQPYPELVAAARKIAARMYPLRFGRTQ